jgi:hypothetical protein
MISFTIDYSKLETLTKIDIENRPELIIIPAFSFGLSIKNELFGAKTKEQMKDTQFLIDKIFNQNHSRKSLSIDMQHKSLSQCFDLRIREKILKTTAILKSSDFYLLGSHYKWNKGQKDYFDLPIFWSTFFLNVDNPHFKTEKKANEIFNILFNITAFRKIVSKNTFAIFLMHSNSIEYLINISEYSRIAPIDYIPSYSLRGTKRIYIENGKESCSHYDSNDRPFDAISRSLCLRKCYQKYCQKKFRCSPLIIKSIISSIDEENNELKFCSRELNDLCDEEIIRENIRNQCLKYCPKDCIDFEIKQTHTEDIMRFHQSNEDKKDFKVQIFWDKNYPLISYIETPVMSFTEYLCNCGGLLGLWFGTNAYQIIRYIMDSGNWISIKYKLQTFARILSVMIWEKINSLLIFVSNFRFRITVDIEW